MKAQSVIYIAVEVYGLFASIGICTSESLKIKWVSQNETNFANTRSRFSFKMGVLA